MDNDTERLEHDKCLTHDTEKIELFCTECRLPVCRECLVISHQRHTFSKLEDQIRQTQDEIQQLTEFVKVKMLPDLEQKLAKAASQKEVYSNEVERVIEDFRAEADRLKTEIDNFVFENEKNIRGIQKEDESKLNVAIKSLECASFKARAAVESNNSEDTKSSLEIFRRHNEITKIVQSKDITIPVIIPPVRITGKHNSGDLSRIIGKLHREQTLVTESSILNKEIILFARYSITGLRIISEFRDNFVWVTNPSFANILDYVKVTESKICLERSLELAEKTVIIGITFTSSEDLYVSTFKSSVLKVIKKGKNRARDFVNLPNLQPYGMCVTQTNELIVCVSDSDSQKYCFNREAKLIRLSVSGKLLGEIGCFEGKRMFVFPKYVAENKNGDLCVSDFISKKKGRVVAVDKAGNLKFNYNGHTGLCNFKPAALVCDNKCRIIATDSSNDAIHVIDEFGNFLQYLVTKENQISEPCSVSISPTGDLWFGCLNSKFCVLRDGDNCQDRESDEFSLI